LWSSIISKGCDGNDLSVQQDTKNKGDQGGDNQDDHNKFLDRIPKQLPEAGGRWCAKDVLAIAVIRSRNIKRKNEKIFYARFDKLQPVMKN
jgi:hypothetical protein